MHLFREYNAKNSQISVINNRQDNSAIPYNRRVREWNPFSRSQSPAITRLIIHSKGQIRRSGRAFSIFRSGQNDNFVIQYPIHSHRARFVIANAIGRISLSENRRGEKREGERKQIFQTRAFNGAAVKTRCAIREADAAMLSREGRRRRYRR